MGRLVYTMNVSVDGYAATSDGGLEWTIVDDELHTWFNEDVRRTDAAFYGRRLWNVMTYWETAESDPQATEVMLEFARIWRATPKIVVSKTLKSVDGNARLVRGDPIEELTRLKAELPGEIGVGGPTLAATFIEHRLVDEYRLVVHPVVLGAGLPFFPALERPIDLELVETRRFQSGVLLLVYRPR